MREFWKRLKKIIWEIVFTLDFLDLGLWNDKHVATIDPCKGKVISKVNDSLHNSVRTSKFGAWHEKRFACSTSRGFHKLTKLEMMALMPTLYSRKYFHFSSLIVSYAFCEHEIRYQWVQEHYISMLKTSFLMAQPKQIWQYWHSCIVERLWKPRLWQTQQKGSFYERNTILKLQSAWIARSCSYCSWRVISRMGGVLTEVCVLSLNCRLTEIRNSWFASWVKICKMWEFLEKSLHGCSWPTERVQTWRKKYCI